MLRKNPIWSVAVLAAIALFSTPSTANADFRMRLDDSTTGLSHVVTDQNFGVGGDSQALAGFMNVTATFGTVSIVTGIGLQQPPIGGLTPGQVAGLDLNGTSISNMGAGTTVRLSLQATGYTDGSGLMTALNAMGGSATGVSSLTFKAWANPLNAVEDYNPVGGPDVLTPAAIAGKSAVPGGSVAAAPVMFIGSGAFSGSSSFDFTKIGLYSLFVEAEIVFSGSGLVTFDQHLTVAVPEPATIAAALTGLPFLGGFMWRRRKAVSLSV